MYLLLYSSNFTKLLLLWGGGRGGVCLCICKERNYGIEGTICSFYQCPRRWIDELYTCGMGMKLLLPTVSIRLPEELKWVDSHKLRDLYNAKTPSSFKVNHPTQCGLVSGQLKITKININFDLIMHFVHGLVWNARGFSENGLDLEHVGPFGDFIGKWMPQTMFLMLLVTSQVIMIGPPTRLLPFIINYS